MIEIEEEVNHAHASDLATQPSSVVELARQQIITQDAQMIAQHEPPSERYSTTCTTAIVKSLHSSLHLAVPPPVKSRKRHVLFVCVCITPKQNCSCHPHAKSFKSCVSQLHPQTDGSTQVVRYLTTLDGATFCVVNQAQYGCMLFTYLHIYIKTALS